MSTHLDDEILGSLAGLSGIDLVVVFGSRATGKCRPDSDLDVAVLSGRSDSGFRRKLQADIAVALAHLAPSGRVDVVYLDEAPVLLRQRIMQTGRVLRCSVPAVWRDWRVRTMREHGDREHVRALFRAAQQRRLQGGKGSDRSGHAVESLERTRELPG